MGQYDRVTLSGKDVTRRNRQMVHHAADALGHDYQCLQGSWRPYTSYSSYTHTGAGVLDLYVYGMATDMDLYRSALTQLKRVGFAAFGRGPWCNMPYHFHCVDLDTHGMDTREATGQIAAYKRGEDGLYYASGPQDDPFPWRPNPIQKWRFHQ